MASYNAVRPNVAILRKVIADPEEREVVRRIVKPDGTVRASKPPVDRADPASGMAAYVWRMVMFYASADPRHQCMPVTAEFDLPRMPGLGPRPKMDLDDPAYLDWLHRSDDFQRDLVRKLDAIVDKVLSAVPLQEQYGVIRWGQALGRVGTPHVREGGTVVYRGTGIPAGRMAPSIYVRKNPLPASVTARLRKDGGKVIVVPKMEVLLFKDRWPGSGLPDKEVTVYLDKKGDVLGYLMERRVLEAEPEALWALVKAHLATRRS